MDKNFKSLFLNYLIFIPLIIGLFLFYYDISIFYVNDDYLLEQMISSGKLHLNGIVIPFISPALSIIINFFTFNTVSPFSIYGLALLGANLLIILASLSLIALTKNGISRIIIYGFNLCIIPMLILVPTYTISSILLTGVGYLGSFMYYRQQGQLKVGFIFYFLLILLGYLVRPEGFIGVTFLLSPFLILLVYLLRSKLKIKYYLIIVFFLMFATLITINSIFTDLATKQDFFFKEFSEFNQIRGSLNYTPPLNKLHQKIIDGDIMKGIWANVDLVLLRSWVYADNSVYNAANIKLALTHLQDELGFRGVLNAHYIVVLKRLFTETSDFHFLILLFLLLIIIYLLVGKVQLFHLKLLFILIISYFIVLYYMAAVMRLPDRTIFPFFLLLILTLPLIFSDLTFKNPFNSKIEGLFLFLISGFIAFIFHSLHDFGLQKIVIQNKARLDQSFVRDLELNLFNRSAIYVGPVSFFPVETDRTYLSATDWKSASRSLELSWATLSPTWRDKASKLGLNPNNVYLSLASKKDVYWVSDSRIAEILNMYMNDRQIYRGKLCPLKSLSGLDGAQIFTYQAKERDC